MKRLVLWRFEQELRASGALDQTQRLLIWTLLRAGLSKDLAAALVLWTVRVSR